MHRVCLAHDVRVARERYRLRRRRRIATTRHVCTRFAMSRWTLRRRLHCEAVDFRTLVAHARLGEARDLLLNTQLPIGEIGVRVGFRSTSAFTRFFTRELGAAPSRFRDGHGDRWR